ncbi:geranylgeranyl pyrophosphate synthase, chloroplastic-like [Fagus crenata]
MAFSAATISTCHTSALLNNPINGPKNPNRIPFSHPKLVLTKTIRATRVNSALFQPFLTEELLTKAINNPLPIFQFVSLKEKTVNKALDEAVPLQHPLKIMKQ